MKTYTLTRSFVLLVTASLVMISAGCSTSQAAPRHSIEVAGPIEVDVHSFGGNVTIDADPRENRAVVQIVRRATHGHGRQREAKESLEEIDYTVDLEPAEIGQRLVVRATTMHAEPHYQRADVYITAPEIENVRVHTRQGRVRVHGVEGNINIETDKSVRVTTNRAITRPVSIVSRDGNIDFRVRGESTGAFDCETVHGEINRRIRYGRFISEAGSSHNRLLGRLNDGTNPIELRSVYGDIRIAVVHNPEQIGQFIFE